MVRNKNHGQQGLNESRGTQGDKLNDDRLNRGALTDDEQRENTRKPDRSTQTRKGSPGKTK